MPDFSYDSIWRTQREPIINCEVNEDNVTLSIYNYNVESAITILEAFLESVIEED